MLPGGVLYNMNWAVTADLVVYGAVFVGCEQSCRAMQASQSEQLPREASRQNAVAFVEDVPASMRMSWCRSEGCSTTEILFASQASFL